METAALSGALDLDDPVAARPVQWIPPRWDWVDPLKDIQAQVLAMEADITSRRKVVEGTGYDVEEVGRENISAVLKGLGENWIPGYKPAFNFQMTLVDAVARWLALNPAWLGRQPGLHPAAGLREAAQLWIGPPPTLANQPPPQELEQMLHIAHKFDVSSTSRRIRSGVQ